MKRVFLAAFFFLVISAPTFGQTEPSSTRVISADPSAGFFYPYYLFVPKTAAPAGSQKVEKPILVSTNNTGTTNDDLSVHEANVKRRIAQMALAFGKLGVPILMPVFPRSSSEWTIYTHALDRDTLITDKKELKRLDLQLAAMIDDARKRLAEEKMPTDRRVLIYGFSAAGMFANRFAFLHPERVKAAAIGSPGGWPIIPKGEHKSRMLRFPIGTADLETVAGRKLNIDQLRKVRFLIFMGDKDENDSVVFKDGYEPEDTDLIFELFGKTPLERWATAKRSYADAELSAEFRLYANIGHTMTPAIIGDVAAFLESAMQ